MSFTCRVKFSWPILRNIPHQQNIRSIATICKRSRKNLHSDYHGDKLSAVPCIAQFSTSLHLSQQETKQNIFELFDFQMKWPSEEEDAIKRDMIIIPDFVSGAEEERLCSETDKSMKRMRYEYDHWDDAIHGYREMEKIDWLPENEDVFQRLRNKAFHGETLPHVHILDLAGDGIIKPHVDSSRFCGSTISGISLLTDCIMRLKRTNEEKYKQGKLDDQPNQTLQNTTTNHQCQPAEYEYFVDVLLKRRSLYIMKDVARYKFTHEVLPTKSLFKGQEIVKDRRVSIICRNQP